MARLVRGQVLVVRQLEFVQASRALGARDTRIVLKHVLPSVVAPVLIAATLGVAAAIMAEAALSFLGLGVQPPTPSWGTMLNTAQQFLETAPWMAWWPGLAIFSLTLSFNLAGDGVRDLLDPKDY
jgi:peptide/nickel transport system permease protein/oligopeptide transport system permease protein